MHWLHDLRVADRAASLRPGTRNPGARLEPQAATPDGLGTRQWRALRASLAFEREARMPTVTQFLQEFGDTQTRSGMSGAAVKAAVAAGALAVVAAGGYFYASSHRTAPPEKVAAVPEKVRGARAPAGRPHPAFTHDGRSRACERAVFGAGGVDAGPGT